MLLFLKLPKFFDCCSCHSYFIDYCFGTMWLLGYTLNLLWHSCDVFGGVLVDDATVVLEISNAIWIWEKTNENRNGWTNGEWLFCTLSIALGGCGGFVSILFLPRFCCDMLKQFSVVVIGITVLTSLLVGFYFNALVSFTDGGKENYNLPIFQPFFLLWFEHQLDKFIAWYGGKLNWVLKHKLIFTGFVFFFRRNSSNDEAGNYQ